MHASEDALTLSIGADTCGLGSGFHGQMAEFMIFHHPMTLEQVEIVEQYLRDK